MQAELRRHEEAAEERSRRELAEIAAEQAQALEYAQRVAAAEAAGARVVAGVQQEELRAAWAAAEEQRVEQELRAAAPDSAARGDAARGVDRATSCAPPAPVAPSASVHHGGGAAGGGAVDRSTSCHPPVDRATSCAPPGDGPAPPAEASTAEGGYGTAEIIRGLSAMPPKARHGAACGGSSPADSSRQASSRPAASPPASPRPASPRDLPSPVLPEPDDDVLAASKAHRSPGTSPGVRRRRRGGREGEGGEREGEREGGAAEGGGAGGEGSSPAGAREGHGRAGAAGHLRRGAHGAPAEEDTVGRGREAAREAAREGDAPPVPEKAPVPADEDDEALALEAAAPHEEPRGHGTKHHVKHYRPRQRAAAASDAEREAGVRERGADPHARRREREHGATAHHGGGHERAHHHSRGAQSHGHGGHSHRRTRSPEAQRRHRSGKRLDSAAPQGMTKPGSAALAALTTGSSAQKFTNSKRDEDGLLFA